MDNKQDPIISSVEDSHFKCKDINWLIEKG